MKNQVIKKGIIFSFILSILAVLSFFVFADLKPKSVKADSKDAIAVRVIPNPEHYSPMRWYQEQGFQGAPQSLLVDGYEAVRDGRTVYVNAANITGDNNLYTNIYLISYNQEAEMNTVDIFGRILSHWKFNANIDGVGACSQDENKFCKIDDDCDALGYCNSIKAKLIRDVERLSDLADIEIAIENYGRRGYYPKLNSGTYLAQKTISTWPSWQDTLAKELGIVLPTDPINKLGLCGDSRYNEITCWDENNKEFAGTIPDGLPENSHVYMYISTDNGHGYSLKALMESGYVACELEENKCLDDSNLTYGNTAGNSAPMINCGNLSGYVNSELNNQYITVSDPDGNEINWDKVYAQDYQTLEPIDWNTWEDVGWQWSDDPNIELGFKILKSTNRQNVKEVVADNIGLAGEYKFRIEVSDSRGAQASTTCIIKAVPRTYCGDGEIQNLNDQGKTEECDNGEANTDTPNPPSYGDQNSEFQYCNTNCELKTMPIPYCGDNNLDSIYEECDIDQGLADWSCLGGDISCDNNCERVCDNLTDPYQGKCGNDMKEGLEECDGSDGVTEWSCVDIAGVFSEAICNNVCNLECSDGSSPYHGTCGDGICNSPSETNANCLSDCPYTNCTFPADFPCYF